MEQYLTYQEYKDAGGELAESDFEQAETFAEMLLDHWTLNRLKSAEVVAELEELKQMKKVKRFMFELVGRVPAIIKARRDRASGQELTSFGNGVNTFGFAQSGADVWAEVEARSLCMQMLPVELVSTDVSYNHAS